MKFIPNETFIKVEVKDLSMDTMQALHKADGTPLALNINHLLENTKRRRFFMFRNKRIYVGDIAYFGDKGSLLLNEDMAEEPTVPAPTPQPQTVTMNVVNGNKDVIVGRIKPGNKVRVTLANPAAGATQTLFDAVVAFATHQITPKNPIAAGEVLIAVTYTPDGVGSNATIAYAE